MIFEFLGIVTIFSIMVIIIGIIRAMILVIYSRKTCRRICSADRDRTKEEETGRW